jgi:hypothetical protein
MGAGRDDFTFERGLDQDSRPTLAPPPAWLWPPHAAHKGSWISFTCKGMQNRLQMY